MAEFQFVLILLAFSVASVAIFRRLQLPPLLGYISVGMLVGPHSLAFIPSFTELNFLAEFGIVFLMFTIGLEFSFSRMLAMKRTLLGLGGVQVILCTGLATLACYWLGIPLRAAIITAGALSLSSTAVVIKQLVDQNELHTVHGRMALSILLFQDIAAVLFLILIPALNPDHVTHWSQLSEELIKGVGVCVILSVAAKAILRPLFHEISKARSTELFMLTALLVALSAAWITHHFNLSMALGAFLAGMLLGESEFKHQVEIDIRPFRDVLLGLFFVSIGALIDIKVIPKNWLPLTLILLGLITAKTLIITALTRLVEKVSLKKAFRCGLILGQGSEFGFVLLTVAINNNLINTQQNQLFVTAVVISIILAPLMIRYNQQIAEFLFKKEISEVILEQEQLHQLAEQSKELKDHVIICGFGRVGQVIARFLEQENIPSLALDLDPRRISSSALAGERIFYGDVRRPEVLSLAGLARARMVVISFADEPVALETLHHIRALRLDVPVFVRTKNDANLNLFREAGATEVVPESLEASLMLASHLLLTLGVPASRILFKVRSIHADRYRMMQGFFKGTDDETQPEDAEELRRALNTVTVPDAAHAVGKPIREINSWSDNMDSFPVKALTRDGVRYLDPEPDLEIAAGDVLVVYATPEEFYNISEKILRGE